MKSRDRRKGQLTFRAWAGEELTLEKSAIPFSGGVPSADAIHLVLLA